MVDDEMFERLFEAATTEQDRLSALMSHATPETLRIDARTYVPRMINMYIVLYLAPVGIALVTCHSLEPDERVSIVTRLVQIVTTHHDDIAEELEAALNIRDVNEQILVFFDILKHSIEAQYGHTMLTSTDPDELMDMFREMRQRVTSY